LFIIRSKGEYLGSVEAFDRERAEAVAVKQFDLDQDQRRWLLIRRCLAQHELPAARDGAGVGAWSDVTGRNQLAESLAAAQERFVHLWFCDIEREPAGVAQLAAD
jgi:hypothetical protein